MRPGFATEWTGDTCSRPHPAADPTTRRDPRDRGQHGRDLPRLGVHPGPGDQHRGGAPGQRLHSASSQVTAVERIQTVDSACQEAPGGGARDDVVMSPDGRGGRHPHTPAWAGSSVGGFVRAVRAGSGAIARLPRRVGRYGSVLAAPVVGQRRWPAVAGGPAVVLRVSGVVFWIAHVYCPPSPGRHGGWHSGSTRAGPAVRGLIPGVPPPKGCGSRRW